MADDALSFDDNPELALPPVTPLLPVPYLLDLLAWRRVSGKVQVVTDGDVYGIYINRGQILAATSTHRTLRLGHLLLQRGAVEALFLHDVLRGRRAIPAGRALGGVLVAEGAITVEELADTVQEQVVEILARLLSLERATFLLIADEPLPTGLRIVTLDTTRVLDAAVERQTERASSRAMSRLLPRADVPLMMTVNLALISHQLTDTELLVTLQIDRSRANLDALGATLPLDSLTIKRTLIGLMERDFVRPDYPRAI